MGFLSQKEDCDWKQASQHFYEQLGDQAGLRTVEFKVAIEHVRAHIFLFEASVFHPVNNEMLQAFGHDAEQGCCADIILRENDEGRSHEGQSLKRKSQPMTSEYKFMVRVNFLQKCRANKTCHDHNHAAENHLINSDSH